MKVDKFIDEFEGEGIYLLDIDSYLGREMNFKIYRALEGVYTLWMDSAPRTAEDVMDIFVSGGDAAVMMVEYMSQNELEKVMEITDSVALKSIFKEDIMRFVDMGGRMVISYPKILNDIKNVDTYTIKNGEVCKWKI